MNRLTSVVAGILLCAAAWPTVFAQAPSDAEIAHIVVTANQVDIDAGKLAATMAVSPEVMKFGQQMVADHKQTVSDFKKQAASGKDADLKAFASSTLPKLEEHLKMAQSLSEATKTSSGEAGKKSSY